MQVDGRAGGDCQGVQVGLVQLERYLSAKVVRALLLDEAKRAADAWADVRVQPTNLINVDYHHCVPIASQARHLPVRHFGRDYTGRCLRRRTPQDVDAEVAVQVSCVGEIGTYGAEDQMRRGEVSLKAKKEGTKRSEERARAIGGSILSKIDALQLAARIREHKARPMRFCRPKTDESANACPDTRLTTEGAR